VKLPIKNILIDSAVASLVVAGEIYSIGYASNAAIFFVWLVTVLGLVVCIMKPEDLFSDEARNVHLNYVSRISTIALIGLIAAVGWFVTAAFYLLSLLLLIGKYQVHKKNAANALEKQQ